MSIEEKIQYMRIACNIAGYGFKDDAIDMIVSLYELILEKKGKGAIDDIVRIEYEVKKRQEIASKKELLNKVSTKRIKS
jgi:hypothetical protein